MKDSKWDNIGVKLLHAEKEGKVYIVSGCIVLATLTQYDKDCGKSWGIEYNQFMIDSLVSPNPIGHLRYTYKEAINHFRARCSQAGAIEICNDCQEYNTLIYTNCLRRHYSTSKCRFVALQKEKNELR